MKTHKNKVLIYQAKNGAIELRGDLEKETIWATQAQIADIFNIDRSVVTKHVGNILKSNEVEEKSNVQKMHIPNSDKPVAFYSLDMILAVGYRANSARAMQFRQWATKTLRQHVIKGYTINPKTIKHHYAEFQKAIADIKHLLPAGTPIANANVLELISAFADTWFSLDAYDKAHFPKTGANKKHVNVTADELTGALRELKQELIVKKEASSLFGTERSAESVSGIVGNIFQSFGGKDLYPSVEEKAAHLLYFTIKNHPFTDGNKRSGAFAFVWFLRKMGLLNTAKMTPGTLTALTLLVAESNPKDKERLIGLILLLLRK